MLASDRHRLRPRGAGQDGGAHGYGQLSARQQLGVDRRDLRQHGLDLGAPPQAAAHRVRPGRPARTWPGRALPDAG